MEYWATKNTYMASLCLSRVQSTEDALLNNIIYRTELEKIHEFLKKGEKIIAAEHIRKARTIVGYERHIEAYNLWVDLYIHLSRKELIDAWESNDLVVEADRVCFSTDKNYLLSIKTFYLSEYERRHDLCLWDMRTSKCLSVCNKYISLDKACLSVDKRFILTGQLNGTLELHDFTQDRCLQVFNVHADSVTSVCWHMNSRYVLSGSDDKTIKILDLVTGQCLRTFNGHMEGVSLLCLSTDGSFALSGSFDKTLKLWDIATGQCLRTFNGHKQGVSSVCLSADGSFALSGSYDKTLKLWNIATGQCLRTFNGHVEYVSSVCLSADGRFILSGSDDRTLKLWDVNTGCCLKTLKGHEDSVYSVCFSADTRLALSFGGDFTLRSWKLLWELEDHHMTDWDAGAFLYLKNFLTLHTPYAATLPTDHEPTEEEVTLALTRRGIPTWTEEDFQNLLYTLGCAGYGWLRPEGIKQQLEAMVADREKSLAHPHPNISSELGRSTEVRSYSPTSANKRSPITSTPTNKRSLTNIKKFWVLLYFIVIAIIIVAVVFSFNFLAGASVSVVLALLLTWLWVWLSR
jgi:WD40 repeat protein